MTVELYDTDSSEHKRINSETESKITLIVRGNTFVIRESFDEEGGLIITTKDGQMGTVLTNNKKMLHIDYTEEG